MVKKFENFINESISDLIYVVIMDPRDGEGAGVLCVTKNKAEAEKAKKRFMDEFDDCVDGNEDYIDEYDMYVKIETWGNSKTT